jgi:hypothetical protein
MTTVEQLERAMDVGNERTQNVLSTLDACLAEFDGAKFFHPVFESREEIEQMRSRIHRRVETYNASRRSKTVGQSFKRPPRKSRRGAR